VRIARRNLELLRAIAPCQVSQSDQGGKLLTGSRLRAVRIFVIAALAAFGLKAAAATAVPATPPFRLVNLAQDFTRFYDETRAMPAEARVVAFKARFRSLFPGFYSAERVHNRGLTEAQFDNYIQDWITHFPDARARYERISREFGGMIARARVDFIRTFPDLAPIGDVYLLPAAGEMDGGTRTIDGHSRLIFGADVMARVHDFDDEQPFFEHELFHVYHQQFFGNCPALWCSLWREGLATYVAHRLNPHASDSQLLLTIPRPIRPRVEANRAAAICAARAGLDGSPRQFFSGQVAPPNLPPRLGYYVGYLVAERLGRNRTLRQLAHMSVAQARPLVAQALADLAQCPAGQGPGTEPPRRLRQEER
jgi:hypothetical protein